MSKTRDHVNSFLFYSCAAARLRSRANLVERKMEATHGRKRLATALLLGGLSCAQGLGFQGWLLRSSSKGEIAMLRNLPLEGLLLPGETGQYHVTGRVQHDALLRALE